MKRRFSIQVERVDEYIVELDDEVLDEGWQAAFREYFYEFDDLEDHAKHIAQHRARFMQAYIEGYGNPLVDGRQNVMSETEPNRAINIIRVSEDDEVDLWAKELKEGE